MQPTHDTLSENIRTQAVELLNKQAAAIDLHGKLKQAHRNVRGPAWISNGLDHQLWLAELLVAPK